MDEKERRALEAASQLVKSGYLRGYLEPYIRESAFGRIATSKPDEVAVREDAYRLLLAVDELFGLLETMAVRHGNANEGIDL